MKAYRVTVTQTIEWVLDVQGETENEAKQLAMIRTDGLKPYRSRMEAQASPLPDCFLSEPYRPEVTF